MHAPPLFPKANVGGHRQTAGSPTTAPPVVPLPAQTYTHGQCLTQRDHGRGPPGITFPPKANVMRPHVCLRRHTTKRQFSTAAASFGPPIRLWRPPPIWWPKPLHDAARRSYDAANDAAKNCHDAARRSYDAANDAAKIASPNQPNRPTATGAAQAEIVPNFAKFDLAACICFKFARIG